jgi:hypothetical protein
MTSTATFPHKSHNPLPSGIGTFSVLENGSMIIYPANSSAIESVHWISQTGSLAVRYANNSTHYYYQDVPATVVFHLLVADSFGKFINTHIKPNYKVLS